MDRPALFRFMPHLESTTPWTPLISSPTPVHRMPGLSGRWGMGDLYVKREDATDSVYGGNKVRNLEFILGEVKARGLREVITVAPRGSNFVAALAAQARKVGITVHVKHFVPAHSPQIDSHFQFSEAQGMRVSLHSGRVGAIPAWVSGSLQYINPGRPSYWVAPGGSSVQGALGHVNAFLELAEQVRTGAIPQPETLIVGAGTCGTMAGIHAGLRVSGLSMKVIGVRCVDRIVCNRAAIVRLANAVLKRLGHSSRLTSRDVTLLAPERSGGYGNPVLGSADLMKEFYEEEGVRLDTTYTTKVVSVLKSRIAPTSSGPTLYWHTFSPAALCYGTRPATAAAGLSDFAPMAFPRVR